LLAGLRPPSRVVTLSAAEHEAAQKPFGRFFPMEIELTVSRDERHALIIWNEGWRGGAARADQDAGGVWHVTVLETWVT
jgi:hypothetical protein